MYKVYGLQDGSWILYDIAKSASEAMSFIKQLNKLGHKATYRRMK